MSVASPLAEGSNLKKENIRLKKEIERLKKLSSFRNRLSELLADTRDFELALELIFKKIVDFLNADAGLIKLSTETAKPMLLRASRGLPQDYLTNNPEAISAMLSDSLTQSSKQNIVYLKPPLDLPKALRNSGFQCALILPIRAGEELFGFIELFCKSKNCFDESQYETLLPVLRQIGIACENMKLLKTLHKRIEQRNRLYLLMHKLQVNAGLHELLVEIVKILEGMYPATHALILLYDPEDQVLRVKAASKEFLEKVGTKETSLNVGITGYAALSRSTVIVNDTSKSPHYSTVLKAIKSELAIPLIIEGKLIGVLDLESENMNAFTEQDSQLLTIYAQQAAMAISKAQLFEEVREQSVAKTRMISTLSHEFKTPLTVIKSYAWFLKNSTDISPQDKNEQLDVILSEVENLNELIDSLLNLGRLEQGRMEWKIVHFDLSAMLEKLALSFQMLAEERNIDIVYQSEASSSLIWGDVARLRQAFMNLISNAIKYNRDGGKVTITVEDAGDDFLRVAVIDTGIGIDKKYVEKIFTRFFRAPGLKIEGMGIGLYLAQQFIEAQGGWIEVKSRPNEGSEFMVYLSKRGGA